MSYSRIHQQLFPHGEFLLLIPHVRRYHLNAESLEIEINSAQAAQAFYGRHLGDHELFKISLTQEKNYYLIQIYPNSVPSAHHMLPMTAVLAYLEQIYLVEKMTTEENEETTIRSAFFDNSTNAAKWGKNSDQYVRLQSDELEDDNFTSCSSCHIS